MLLDTHSLKIALLNLPNYSLFATNAPDVQRKAPSSYTKIVIKDITRAEMILKCIMSPLEPMKSFIDNYIKLINDYNLDTFKKILEMKGINKKTELNLFIDLFKSEISSNEKQTRQQEQQQVNSSNRSVNQFEKFQELIRMK